MIRDNELPNVRVSHAPHDLAGCPSTVRADNDELVRLQGVPKGVRQLRVQHVLKLEVRLALVKLLGLQSALIQEVRINGLALVPEHATACAQARICIQAPGQQRGELVPVLLALSGGRIPTRPDAHLHAATG